MPKYSSLTGCYADLIDDLSEEETKYFMDKFYDVNTNTFVKVEDLMEEIYKNFRNNGNKRHG